LRRETGFFALFRGGRMPLSRITIGYSSNSVAPTSVLASGDVSKFERIVQIKENYMAAANVPESLEA
jgi:hypothetical protein